MEKESDFGFFSDIRGKAVAVLVGLGSMFTLVPAFFNNLQDYFGVDNVFYQVLIFKILYFFIPSLFLPYLLFRYIKGNRLLVHKFRQALLFFISLFLIFYILLFFEFDFIAWDYINILFYCIVITVAILIFAFSFNEVRRVRTYGWGTANRQKWHNIRIQYITIGGLFVCLSLIYFNEHKFLSSFIAESRDTQKKNTDASSLKKINYLENLTDDYVGVRKKADSLNQQLIALYHYTSITRAVEGNPDILSSSNLKLVQNGILKNDFDLIKKNFTGIEKHFTFLGDSSVNERYYNAHSNSLRSQCKAIDICRNSVRIMDTIADSLALTKVYILLAQSDHILKTAYAQEESFRDYKAWVWVRYMTNLQHRTLPFFFLLIISTFTLWIRFYFSILSVKRRFSDKTNFQRKDYYLGYCKDYIYVLILLILPYFKPYSQENFKYDHPMLQSHINLTSAPDLKNSNVTDLSELRKRVGKLEIETGKLASDYTNLKGEVFTISKEIDTVSNWKKEEEEFVKRTQKGISVLNSSIEP